jgi:hypothetical protein
VGRCSWTASPLGFSGNKLWRLWGHISSNTRGAKGRNGLKEWGVCPQTLSALIVNSTYLFAPSPKPTQATDFSLSTKPLSSQICIYQNSLNSRTNRHPGAGRVKIQDFLPNQS